MRVLLSARKKRLGQRERRYSPARDSRVDAALRQSEEEVEVGVDMGGKNDDIDDLFGEVVDRGSHGTLRITYTEDRTDGGGLDCSSDQAFDDAVGP